jgi:hypothetical protein
MASSVIQWYRQSGELYPDQITRLQIIFGNVLRLLKHLLEKADQHHANENPCENIGRNRPIYPFYFCLSVVKPRKSHLPSGREIRAPRTGEVSFHSSRKMRLARTAISLAEDSITIDEAPSAHFQRRSRIKCAGSRQFRNAAVSEVRPSEPHRCKIRAIWVPQRAGSALTATFLLLGPEDDCGVTIEAVKLQFSTPMVR